MNKYCKTLLALCTGALISFSAHAEEIKIGMSTALSGPASALGNGVKAGVEAYFNKINSQGGINGHTLKLVAMDDGYEPSKAAPNMRNLIEKEKVVAVIGNVGTPTAMVAVPIANELKTPLFGAFTGAGVLRKNPPEKYIINYRASYAQETAAMIDGLLSSGIKPEEIAFFTQNDGYGDAGFNGARIALAEKGFNNIDKLAHGRYERNTTNVEAALGALFDVDTEPKAIIMVGAYKPSAKFIKLAKEEFPEAKFINVSFVGSGALKKELGADAEGVIITQVVPHYESDLPAVKEYREAIKNNPDFVSLEGYLIAKIFTEGLKNAEDPLNREAILSGLEAVKNFDLGIGEKVNFSATERQASHMVWPTVVKNGKFVPLKDWKQAL